MSGGLSKGDATQEGRVKYCHAVENELSGELCSIYIVRVVFVFLVELFLIINAI